MTAKPRIISRTQIHDGFVKLYDTVLEMPRIVEGKPPYKVPREMMAGTDSVLVLIYVPSVDSFLMTREYRAGIICNEYNDDNPLNWQCVAGALDKDLGIEETAREELKEEAGIDAQDLTLELLTGAYASPGRMTEKVWLYLAKLDSVPETGIFGLIEEGEEIISSLIRREEVYRMMDSGEIIDSMTLLALCWYRVHNG